MNFLYIKRLFTQKQDHKDFSTYLEESPQTRKQLLLEECIKNNVSIHVDDSSETSSGIYANFRGVASEAELERRLNAKTAIIQSKRANFLARLALLFSAASFIVSLAALIKN